MEHPLFYTLRTPDGRRAHEELCAAHPSLRRIDAYRDELSELYLVRHPALRFDEERKEREVREFLDSRAGECPFDEQGSWVYFPWNDCLVHILDKDEFYELRTSRNRNLVRVEEQSLVRKALVGIAGLSVGNSVSLALALLGYERLRIADGDVLSLSNLNRVRAGVMHLGMKKSEIAFRQIQELHPYAEVQVFPDGLSDAVSVRRFTEGLSVVVDEMDDIAMKLEVRRAAREMRIPVVSAADNGDGAILHVERFDEDPERAFFHGRVLDLTPSACAALSPEERIGVINAMVGEEYVQPRMMESVHEVGRTLYAWPQLGGAAMVSGGALAWAVKEIVLGRGLMSGIYNVSFDRMYAGDGRA